MANEAYIIVIMIVMIFLSNNLTQNDYNRWKVEAFNSFISESVVKRKCSKLGLDYILIVTSYRERLNPGLGQEIKKIFFWLI